MKMTFGAITTPKRGTLVLLAGDGPALTKSAASIDDDAGGLVTRAAAAARFKGKNATFLDIVAPTGLALDRIVVAGMGNAKDLGEHDWVKLGGAIAGRMNALGIANVTVRCDPPIGSGATVDIAGVAARLALGMRLRAYRFDRYKTKARDDDEPALARIAVQSESPGPARKAFAAAEAVADGVDFARDLVNEPPNVLYPAEFAKRLKEMAGLGLSVDVLGQKDLEKLKMGALLAVAQGSRRDPRVVVMVHQGGGNEAPIAFVGKGVTFDTGGISLKSSANMGDMKGDMAGAACVAGLMRALAVRKARVNAVGLVGLVENMPDGRALRPGDVVTSMSGQTVEVLNTDAEGRLVLCDVLHYASERFKPRAMVDLATLTGAIIVALGKHMAGMFTNDDGLAEWLSEAGAASGEAVWRMPLGPEYDKMLNSKVADMKNIGGRDAGSVTAAQFLKRFVGDTPWVHLDIAGTGMDAGKSETNSTFGTGYGVRLLDRLVADHFEDG